MIQYGVEQALVGRPIDPGGALTAFSSAAIGQMIGEVGTVALLGTPSEAYAMTRLSLDDFRPQGLTFSSEYYTRYPDMRKLLERETVVRAGGQVVRDTMLNVGLGSIAE